MPHDDLDRSPIHLLHRAAQCVDEAFFTNIQNEGLTPRQFVMLIAIASNEGQNQAHLTHVTGIDRSTLADVVKRLQRKGWLQRQRIAEDARAYAVRLTDEGRRVLRKAEPQARRADEGVLAALPASQRRRFVDALSLIVKTLEPPVRSR